MPTTPSGLFVDVRGHGTPTVVLVHAGIADRRMWDREFVALSQRYRVVRYDVRGFGRSADPDSDYYDHDDLCEVLDATDTDSAVLIGASNGGRIAADAAVMAPERVSALVLAAAALPGTRKDPRFEAGVEQEDVALEAGDIDRARDVNLDLFVNGVGRSPGQVSADVRVRTAAWLDELLPRQVEQMRANLGDAQQIDPPLRARLGDITAPTLIMVGAHDLPTFRLAAQHFAEHIPHSRLDVIDGAAHLINLERPERFDAAVATFLADHGGIVG